MKDRIKMLRKALGLTQQKFAEALGLKQNTIAQYEIGRNEPVETVLNLICREFKVSRTWLYTGEGEMFVHHSRDEEIAALVGDILADEEETFRKRYLAMLARLGPDEWKLLEKMALELAAEFGEKKD